jgi:hypothetical protein
MALATIYQQAQPNAPAVNPVRATLAGLWIGFWIAALALSGYGIWFVNTHPGPDPWTYGPALGQSMSELDQYDFWWWVNFGPVVLFMLRMWKWIVTLCLIHLGFHHHMVAGLLVGGSLVKWNGQRGWRRYTAWLGASPSPSAIAASDRVALRIAFVCGIALYSFTVSNVYPKSRGLLPDQPVIPEPTPPATVQNATISTQKGPSYSQNSPVIHSGCVVSTQNEPEVRYAYPADEAIHQEPDGRWYPDETLSDINRQKQAEAKAPKHRLRHK